MQPLMWSVELLQRGHKMVYWAKEKENFTKFSNKFQCLEIHTDIPAFTCH